MKEGQEREGGLLHRRGWALGKHLAESIKAN